ncbi:MAG TPA: FtsX-like permease family protein [Galbitalea sp.]|jgi:hypothetical protein
MLRVWRRRSGAQRFVLVTSAATVLILSFALSTVVGLSSRIPVNAVRTTVSDGPASIVADTLSATESSHPSRQDAVVRQIIAHEFRGAPLTVSRHVIPRSKEAEATVVWTIQPDQKTVRPDDLADIASGYKTIDDAVTNSSAAESPDARLAGHGAATVAAMRGSVAAVQAVLPIPVIVLSLAGLIALVLCSLLLSAARENETRLLRARGGSVSGIVGADLRESLIAAVATTVVGTAAAQVLVLATAGPPSGVLEVLLPPVGAIVAAVAVSAITAAVAARSANGAPRPSSGRARTAFSLSFTVLLIAVAAIAVWRFLQYGTPTPGAPADFAAILAPAAILSATAMVGLVILTPVAGRVEAASGRSRGLRATLPIRQIHRNLGLFAGPVALIILAIGTTGLASSYSATWSGFLDDSTHLTTGSDIRATLAGQSLASDADELVDIAAFARLPHADTVAPVLRESDTYGDQTITTIGVAAGRVAGLVSASSTVIDATKLSRQLVGAARAPAGIALPVGTVSLQVALTATEFKEVAGSAPTGANVVPSLWILDSAGDLAPLTGSPIPVVSDAVTTPAMTTLAVPKGGPWKIIAVDAIVDSQSTLTGFHFALTGLSASAGGQSHTVRVPANQGWGIQKSVFSPGQSVADGAGGIGFTDVAIGGGDVGSTAARLMPAESDLVPVVVSKALADVDRLHLGSRLDVDGQWASYRATVVGTAPLVPGVTSSASLIADLPSLENGWLRNSEQVPALHEVWMSSNDRTVTATAAARLAGGPTHVLQATGILTSRFIDSAVTGLWLGAIGSAAFAIIALLASVATILRRRAREVAILRALGLTAREQVRMRRLEVLLVTGYSVVCGAVSAVIVTAIVAATLARSSTPAAPAALTVHTQVNVVAIAAVLAAMAVAAIIVMVPYEAGVSMRAAGRRANAGEQ